ncbi:MAG: polyprenol phosphomannose-dependent alpha 1,6 mannosyltransferase MptB, partial [Actinomycetes bacterium]
MTGSTWGRLAVATALVAVTLFAGVALLGPSAASPVLIGSGPTRSLSVEPSAWVVSVGMWGALLLSACSVAAGWWALRRDWQPDPRRTVAWGLGGAAVMALVPPLGSSDVLSYAVYGRMVATGLNPYTTTAADLVAARDPVGLAYAGAWGDVSSVYGPVASAWQGAISALTGTSVVWFVVVLQLGGLALFAATGLLLLKRGALDLAGRRRVAWLWFANPLLWYLLVNSAHLDGLAVLLGTAGLVVAARSPVASGVLAALAVCTKVSYVLY